MSRLGIPAYRLTMPICIPIGIHRVWLTSGSEMSVNCVRWRSLTGPTKVYWRTKGNDSIKTIDRTLITEACLSVGVPIDSDRLADNRAYRGFKDMAI